MKIDEAESPMLANDCFNSVGKSLKSIKKLPDIKKTPSLPKIRNMSTEFVTPNISKTIFN